MKKLLLITFALLTSTQSLQSGFPDNIESMEQLIKIGNTQSFDLVESVCLRDCDLKNYDDVDYDAWEKLAAIIPQLCNLKKLSLNFRLVRESKNVIKAPEKFSASLPESLQELTIVSARPLVLQMLISEISPKVAENLTFLEIENCTIAPDNLHPLSLQIESMKNLTHIRFVDCHISHLFERERTDLNIVQTLEAYTPKSCNFLFKNEHFNVQ